MKTLVLAAAIALLPGSASASADGGWKVPDPRAVVIDGHVRHLGAVLDDYRSTGIFEFSFINSVRVYTCGNDSFLALQSVGEGTVRVCRATGSLYAQVAVDAQYLVEKGVAVVQGGNRQSVCHELGHVLGLDHSRSGGSCMKPLSTSGVLNQHDREQLAAIYG